MDIKKFINEQVEPGARIVRATGRDRVQRRKFRSEIPDPPSHLRGWFRENLKAYIETGKLHTEAMIGLFDQFDMESLSPVVDFGCASGRMMRNFFEKIPKEKLWGVDTIEDHIIWNKNNYGQYARFCLTSTFPSLPFKDEEIGFLYAGSVFTHIGNTTDLWLMEIRRILRPGGYFFLTINDENTVKELNFNPAYLQDPLQVFLKDNHDILNDLESNLRFWNRELHPKLINTFYSREYFLEEVLSELFEVINFKENLYGYQTGILARVKS